MRSRDLLAVLLGSLLLLPVTTAHAAGPKKPAAASDEEDADAAPPAEADDGADEAPAPARKKKPRAARPADADEDEAAPADEEAPAPVKKKKKKKKKAAPVEEAAPADDAAPVDEEAPAPVKKKKKKKKAAPADDAAAAPADDAAAAPADDAPPAKKKKKKKKKPAVEAPAEDAAATTGAGDAPGVTQDGSATDEGDVPAAIAAPPAREASTPARFTLSAMLLGAAPLDRGNRALFGVGGGVGVGAEAYVTPLLGVHAGGAFVLLTKDGGSSSTSWLGAGVGPRVHLGPTLYGEQTHHDAWLEAHASFGSSGGIRRPGFDVAAALQWEVTGGLRLGPVLRYQFGSDPRDKNAQLFTLGLAVDLGGGSRVAYTPPPPPDTDADGIIDAEDQCPRDSAGDEPDPSRPGCPTPPDADGDGVPDAKDLCPEEAAGDEADPERAGCPAPPPPPPPPEEKVAEIKGDKIEIFQQVYFENDSATIEDRSDKVLEAVGKIIRELDGKRVRIEGHTDEKGTDGYNLDLSRRRARAVAQWLVQNAGIEATRLVTEGYGKSRPLVKGGNTDLNRRVEFVILEK